RDNFAGLDVELAVMEVAFDHVAIDVTFRERSRTVRAGIVGHEKLAVDVEDCQDETGRFDFERVAGRDSVGFAEFDAGRHGCSCWAGTSKIAAGTMFRIEEMASPP